MRVFILQLAIILLASKLAGSLSVKLGQPSVLGKLLVGIVLGPSVLGLINETETLEEFSKIGVILLMFAAGLETDIDEFKRAGKASAYVGFGGMIVPFVFSYIVGIMLHFTTMQALFLGLLLSATSVSISVQALKELKQLKTREGTTILGAAVIDDVVIIVALAFLMSFTDGDVHLTTVILKKALFFIGTILVGWKVVPWFLKKVTRLNVTETLLTSALIICFVFAYFAEYTGIAAIIGAYIAGVSINITSFKNEVFKKVETISYSIFVPVFFTSIGISAQFAGITHYLDLIAILSVLAIVTKLAGSGIGAKLAGFSWHSSLGIGSAMIPCGEVALIMAAIGLDSNLLTQEMFAVIVAVIFVTTIATLPLMKLSFKSNM
ncbi:cation:proton antiporter [Domibacillus mangrovi]|uniref:Sodium:proton antiporter n=1 Tax=Domibacillus mangrovi TaxID=1714354 RepID=A0A1Q5P064_9BACI|nr:cation:proton antiporter [Domibacillus mangrovi]OKL35586.1 sodium:proton antiporter [Domibacillus mangrovi]